MTGIDLYYFSGTGNTFRVTRYLAAELAALGVRSRLVNLEDLANAESKSSSEEPSEDAKRFAILFPVFGFNAPRLVEERLEFLPVSSRTTAYIIFVSSDPMWINDGSARRIRKRIERRGGVVSIERCIPMPNNWAVGYPPGLRDQLDIAARREAKRLAREITDRVVDRIDPGIPARIVSFLGRAEQWGDRYFGRSLYATNACTSCGECAMSCPMGNIEMADGRPNHGKNCMMCMRCVYACPVRAIRSKGYSFLIIEEGYLAKTAFGTGDDTGTVTAETRGFFAHLKEYLFQD